MSTEPESKRPQGRPTKRPEALDKVDWSKDPEVLAAELGVGVSSIYNWRREAIGKIGRGRPPGSKNKPKSPSNSPE